MSNSQPILTLVLNRAAENGENFSKEFALKNIYSLKIHNNFSHALFIYKAIFVLRKRIGALQVDYVDENRSESFFEKETFFRR